MQFLLICILRLSAELPMTSEKQRSSSWPAPSSLFHEPIQPVEINLHENIDLTL